MNRTKWIGLALAVVGAVVLGLGSSAENDSGLKHADTLRSQCKYSKALVEYDKILKDAPNDAEAWMGKGFCQLRLRKHDEASASLTKAMVLMPDRGEVTAGMAILKLRQQDRAAAIQLIEKAVAQSPDCDRVWTAKSEILNSSDDLDGALACAEKAIELNPNCGIAYSEKGSILSHRGQEDEAFKLYQVAIEKNPFALAAYNNLASQYLRRGQHEQALKTYNRGIEIDEDFTQLTLRSNKSLFLAEMGKEEEAIRLCDEVLASRPDDAGALAVKGWALYDAGDYAGAIKMYEACIASPTAGMYRWTVEEVRQNLTEARRLLGR